MANILTIQIQPKIGNREENIGKVKSFIEKNADKSPDLIVMPEFFNTGIGRPAFERLAEPENNSPTLDYFKQTAKEYSTYILCGSIIEKEQDKLYNTSYLLDRGGNTIAKYRKMNLFKYFGGTEDQYITPGNDLVIADTDFGKVGLNTCFDITYPAHIAKLVKNGAEIILCPAAWCVPNDEKVRKTGLDTWKAWNTARAIDNSVYLISSNLCGKVDSFLSCVGHSRITAFTGETLACAGDGEGTAFAQIDIGALNEYRKIAPDKLLV